MNIVLIISDTFRRDHLGCYGNPWIRTPHLSRFAEEAIVFDRCYAASFPTMPNRADILTGKYSFTYLGWAPLPSEETTLPQLLSEAGYSTMGIVDTPFYMRNGYGYDRGFDDFLWIQGQRITGLARDDVTQAWCYEEDRFAPRTLATAEKWLEKHYKEKFFLLVDTWDPHEPWDPPAHYVEMYGEDYDGRPSPWPCYWEWEEAGLSEKDVERAHAHYCGEVTMVDRWVGRLLERIESLGLMEDTAIIFTSDHGFYFGEHGMFGKGKIRSEHGFRNGLPTGLRVRKGRRRVRKVRRGVRKVQRMFRDPATGHLTVDTGQWYRSPLYEEVARIPLLIYLPQSMATRTDALVSSPDLMPTLLQLADLGVPEAVQSTSLIPLLREERQKVHDLIITSWPLYNPGELIRVVDDWQRIVAEPLPSTITDGEWTLVYATVGEPVELYHIASDSKQRENVFEDNETVARDLHARFVDFLERVGTDEAFLAPRRRLL